MKPLEAAQWILADYEGTLRVEHSLNIEGVQSSIVQLSLERMLIIRGTDQTSDWLRYNFRFLPESASGDKYEWHSGFLKHAQIAYAFAKDKGVTIVLGHSLGAAAAGIVACSLGVPAITFATPRALFGTLEPPESKAVLNYCRIDDLVTLLPPSFLGFRHCGRVKWLRTQGLHIGEDHRMMHYLELLALKDANP